MYQYLNFICIYIHVYDFSTILTLSSNSPKNVMFWSVFFIKEHTLSEEEYMYAKDIMATEIALSSNENSGTGLNENLGSG